MPWAISLSLSLSQKKKKAEAIVWAFFIICLYYHAYLSSFRNYPLHAETCCKAVECVLYSVAFSVTVFYVILLYKTPGFDSMLK